MRSTTMMALAWVVAGSTAANAQQEDFRWSGRVAEGAGVRVQGISGSVRAELASGSEVEVVARTRGPDAARVRVAVEETASGITVCAVHPGSSGEGSCLGSGSRGRDGERYEASVDFTVRVPAGVRLSAALVEGPVTATGLRGPVDVSTVSGDIRVSSTGPVTANSVSGAIDATMGAVRDRGSSFNTVSGNITLRVASGVGAQVSVNTLSGAIASDYELERPEQPGRGNVQVGRRATGRIGAGGPALSVNTVSGDVALRRGG
jgi:hypothetical protein